MRSIVAVRMGRGVGRSVCRRLPSGARRRVVVVAMNGGLPQMQGVETEASLNSTGAGSTIVRRIGAVSLRRVRA